MLLFQFSRIYIFKLMIQRQSTERNRLKTNKLLLQLPSEEENSFTFYLPSYVRTQIEKFSKISIETKTAELIAQIKIDIDVTNLDDKMVEYIEKKIIIQLHEDGSFVNLSQEKKIIFTKRDIEDKNNPNKYRRFLTFRYRQTVNAKIIPDVFWAPFQTLYLILSISLIPITIYDFDLKRQFQKIIQNGLTFEENEYLNKMKNKRYEKQYLKKQSKVKNGLISRDNILRLQQITKSPNVSFKFNIMDFKFETLYIDEQTGHQCDSFARLSWGKTLTIEQYRIPPKLLKIQYTNQQKNERQLQMTEQQSRFPCKCIQEEQYQEVNLSEQILEYQQNQGKYEGVEEFKTAHFEIPLYRKIDNSFLKLFLPIWLLGWAAMVLFLIQLPLMEKVTTLATIILGYFGLVAQTNPHANSKLNFYETLIYVKIFLLFFTIIVSFAENNDAQSKTFNWKTNPFFIIFVIIQIVETVIDIKLIITYFCVTLPSDNIKKGITIKLRIHEWQNVECDRYFEEQNKKSQIIIKEYPTKVIPEGQFQGFKVGR